MAVNIEAPESFIVDASFVLSYLLPDEKNEYVKEFFSDYQKRKVDFVSINLLPYEVINGLKSAIIQKRISIAKAKLLIKELSKLDFVLEKIEEIEVLALSISYKISVYDASYLWLAKDKRLKLLSLDENLTSKTKR